MSLRKGCQSVKNDLCLKCICKTCENKHCDRINITPMFKDIKHNCLCKNNCDNYIDWVKLMFLDKTDLEFIELFTNIDDPY